MSNSSMVCSVTGLTISSGFQIPNWTAFTRFTGALLGVKRSMVVAMATEHHQRVVA
jgi:hypothetical protein